MFEVWVLTTKKQREKSRQKRVAKETLEAKTKFITVFVEKIDFKHLDIEELETSKEIDERIKEQQEKEASRSKGDELDSIVLSIPEILAIKLQKSFDAYAEAQEELRELILEHELRNAPKQMLNKRDISWLHKR